MAYQPKSYRKFLAGSVSAALVASAVGPVVANAESFSDVKPDDSHKANIEALVQLGYIKGFNDGTFKPYQSITRGQVAKIFARILKDRGFQVPEDKKAFDDVPVDSKDQELVEAAAIVKNAGVMTGTDGKLNPGQPITRQQMAKVLVEAFDLTKPADFTSKITDLDKADEWAREYIQTLEANGVTVVTEFKPKDNVTRAAFASFVKRALDASSAVTADDITAVKFVDENTLEVTFNGELKEVKKEDFTIEGVEIDSVSIKAAAAAESKTTVVVIKTKTKLEEGKTYTVAYKGKTTDKTKVEVPVVTPKVESVSAINAAQIVVTFNKAVDKDSAETAANYLIDNSSTGITPKVKDEKTVILHLSAGLAASLQQETKEVTIKNVKLADDATKSFATYTEKVKFLDLTPPTVTEVKQVAPNQIRVFFSEPVNAATGDFLIDDGKYSASVSAVEPLTNSVLINTGNLADGEHTLKVKNTVKDYAGWRAAETDVKFIVAKDTTAPTLVSAEAKGQKEVILTFSEAVDGLAANEIFHTAEISGYAASSVEPVEGSNGTQYKATFTSPLPTGTAKILVKKEAVTDKWGNKNTDTLTVNVNVTADTEKPTVKEFKLENATTAKVVFTEDVDGAADRANYKVTDKDGKAVAGYTVSYDSTKKTATITFNPALKENEQYTLEIANLKDKAVVPNVMDKYTTTFTVGDTTAPTVQSVIFDASKRKITVFFSEAMDGSIAIDKSKYTLVINGTELPLPSDAQVTMGANNASVEIVLPAVMKDKNGNEVTVDGTNDSLIIGQLQDVAGNKTSVFTTKAISPAAATVNIDGNVGSIYVAGSLKAIDTRTVQFELSQPLQTIAANDFTVNGVTAEFADFENKTLSNGQYGAVVTLKVPEANKWSTDVTSDTVDVVTASGSIDTTTAYGSKLAAGQQLGGSNHYAADKVAPAVAKVGDKYNVVAIDNNEDGKVESIKITFSEALKSGTVSLDDFDVVGYDETSFNHTGSTVTIGINTVANGENTDSKFVVKLVGNVQDMASNTLEASPTSPIELETLIPVQEVSAATLKQVFTQDPSLYDSTLSDGNAEVGVGPLANLTGTLNGSRLTVAGTLTQQNVEDSAKGIVQYIRTPADTAKFDLYLNGTYQWTAVGVAAGGNDTQWIDTTKGYAKVATTIAVKADPNDQSSPWVVNTNNPVRTYKLVFKAADGTVLGTTEYTLDFSGITIQPPQQS
jgi:trimeric autotransporter adhesin